MPTDKINVTGNSLIQTSELFSPNLIEYKKPYKRLEKSKNTATAY